MKNSFVALVVLCAANALAMPTPQELKKAQPLVAELMAPIMDDFKAKKKTAAEVADAAVKYAQETSTEAAKLLLLKGAISYYVRGESYDKAAEVIEQLKANVKDVPAEVVAEIISKATVRANKEKAPRLFKLCQQAKAQTTAEKDVKELRKNAAGLANTRSLAEALAISGDWDAALKEFAKLKDQAGQMAKAEQDGSAKSAELGEFWWTYKPTCENTEATFKIRAVFYYRKALVAGEITGLKKSIVEQRLKEYAEVFEMHAAGIPRKSLANGSTGGLKKVEKRSERTNCQDSVAVTPPAVVAENESTWKSIAGGREGKAWQEKGNAVTLDADSGRRSVDSREPTQRLACVQVVAANSQQSWLKWLMAGVMLVVAAGAAVYGRNRWRRTREGVK